MVSPLTDIIRTTLHGPLWCNLLLKADGQPQPEPGFYQIRHDGLLMPGINRQHRYHVAVVGDRIGDLQAYNVWIPQSQASDILFCYDEKWYMNSVVKRDTTVLERMHRSDLKIAYE